MCFNDTTANLRSVANESPEKEDLLFAIVSELNNQLLVSEKRDVDCLVFTSSHYPHGPFHRERWAKLAPNWALF